MTNINHRKRAAHDPQKAKEVDDDGQSIGKSPLLVPAS